MAVAITRRELEAAGRRGAAMRCRDARAARRMLALALVLEGGSREAAARHTGMDRQTLRDRVRRYHEEGLAGLHDRQGPGPKPRLTAEQEVAPAAVVERAPEPERDGVAGWRRVDLKAVIETRLNGRLHRLPSGRPRPDRGERSVGKLPRRLGFARLPVRPKHPSGDLPAQEACKKASPSW